VTPLLHDDKKPKKVQRPCFSQEMACWIFDFIFNLGRSHDIYLFMVNMNTRYLVAEYTSHKSGAIVKAGIKKLKEEVLPVVFANVRMPGGERPIDIQCIMGDGERAFKDISVRNLDPNIRFIINSSAYTFHGKILDRCVRTIRDGIGYTKAKSKREIYQIIDYYNNTYHIGIDCTPLEMMQNPDWEFQYIRYCQKKVAYVNRYRRATGLFNYVKGNILFLHLEHSKTRQKFE
jgi:hypothetical protein